MNFRRSEGFKRSVLVQGDPRADSGSINCSFWKVRSLAFWFFILACLVFASHLSRNQVPLLGVPLQNNFQPPETIILNSHSTRNSKHPYSILLRLLAISALYNQLLLSLLNSGILCKTLEYPKLLGNTFNHCYNTFFCKLGPFVWSKQIARIIIKGSSSWRTRKSRNCNVHLVGR